MADQNRPPGVATYNEFSPSKSGDSFVRSYKPSYTRYVTQAAFRELEAITSWEEFARICEEQERKRGWGLVKP